MHSSSTTDHASLGRRLRSAAPRLVPAAPAASPTRLILSTTNERMASPVDIKTEKSLKDSPKSSLLASDVHGLCSRNRCRDALCRNTTEWDTKQAAGYLEILSPVEIDNKTTAILAPTASPKPQPPSAIARLATYTAGNLGSTTSRKWAEDAIQVSQKNRSRKAVRYNASEPQKRGLIRVEDSILMHEQLTTIELRLDEGSVGRKAQSTVGGSIKRKLVPCPTRSLRLDRSTENHILPVQVDSRPGCPPVYDSTFPRDPFADEKSFEENLFDGLLCECPTGSSTPKSATLTPQLHRNGEGDDDRSHHFAIESESLSAQNPDRKIDIDGSCKGKTAIESICGYGRVKKHPSPSKKALEDLELAFAIYTKLKPLEGGDETDELAKDERGALSAADHNKAMRQHRKFAVPEEAHEMAHRRAYRIRHSLPYRPTVKNTQDIDELRC
ncbi:uncharacterized protein BBA_05358 [Beauveria bassiana ARSEF 2860]|uniref:Uncharacterized protein n=1 Tax=Beauveria bassiana (strain ARSEF 2860) TaxID=655819 RepID=J4KND0_BEAB2|nr:uncharacterized protein BBA_05358 [Beauveria bassiana ARSEF 2860]EJP65489.1 hypothetical protein BBA_05358 [Beauveria bassiana ARSEF 2860]